MDYFYTHPDNVHGDHLVIDGEEFAHMVHVMRKDEGNEIRVVDGKGNAFDVRLVEVNRRAARGVILQSFHHHHEPVCRLTLAVGVLKNPSKFDFLVEKTTELGVSEIIPITTERTISHHAKTDRWQKLALAAMKQSGRSYLPQVHNVISLEEVLDEFKLTPVKVLAHEQERAGNNFVASELANHNEALLFVGPEGGFSDAEVHRAIQAGCRTLYLGERRLRTETAAIVATSLLLSTLK